MDMYFSFLSTCSDNLHDNDAYTVFLQPSDLPIFYSNIWHSFNRSYCWLTSQLGTCWLFSTTCRREVGMWLPGKGLRNSIGVSSGWSCPLECTFWARGVEYHLAAKIFEPKWRKDRCQTNKGTVWAAKKTIEYWLMSSWTDDVRTLAE